MNKRKHSYKSYENRKHDDLNIKCKDLEVNIVINGICKKRNISKSDLLIEMVKERYPEEYKIAKANKNTIDSVILCMQMNLKDLDEYEKNMMLYFIERLKKIDNKGE